MIFGKSVLNAYSYQVFGVQLSGRNFTATGVTKKYKMGYQGSEMDSEVKGSGNSYTTEFRQLDPRLGRWLTIDPMVAKLPWQSPYCSMDNNPVLLNDPLGDYTKEKAEKKAARARENGYTATVVESRKRKNDYGVRYYKVHGGQGYAKTQYFGKFTGIGSKGKVKHGYMPVKSSGDLGGDVVSEGVLTEEEAKMLGVGKYANTPAEYLGLDYSKNENSSEDNAYDGPSGVVGPTLILLGQPIKMLKPVGMLGSKPGSSIASYTLSKVFPQTFTKTFGRAAGTKIVTYTGTNVIGRFAGRAVPVVGWLWLINDIRLYHLEKQESDPEYREMSTAVMCVPL